MRHWRSTGNHKQNSISWFKMYLSAILKKKNPMILDSFFDNDVFLTWKRPSLNCADQKTSDQNRPTFYFSVYKLGMSLTEILNENTLGKQAR